MVGKNTVVEECLVVSLMLRCEKRYNARKKFLFQRGIWMTGVGVRGRGQLGVVEARI